MSREDINQHEQSLKSLSALKILEAKTLHAHKMGGRVKGRAVNLSKTNPAKLLNLLAFGKYAELVSHPSFPHTDPFFEGRPNIKRVGNRTFCKGDKGFVGEELKDFFCALVHSKQTHLLRLLVDYLAERFDKDFEPLDEVRFVLLKEWVVKNIVSKAIKLKKPLKKGHLVEWNKTMERVKELGKVRPPESDIVESFKWTKNFETLALFLWHLKALEAESIADVFRHDEKAKYVSYAEIIKGFDVQVIIRGKQKTFTHLCKMLREMNLPNRPTAN